MTHTLWHIVHVDLRGPLPELPASPAAEGVYLVYWLGDVPLGDVYLRNDRLPLTSAELREVALRAIAPAVGGYFAALEDRWRGGDHARDYLRAARADSLPGRTGLRAQTEAALLARSVSVVVCTRERPDALQRCLAALTKLEPAPLEILVVDNAPSTDATRRVVAQAPGIRYVCEPRPGLDIARNTGLRHATGDLIAYTDDDVEAHARWVQHLAAAFQDPGVMAVTGLTFPARLDTAAQVLFEYYWSFNRGYQPVLFDRAYFAEHSRSGVPVWTIGAGANMAFRREVFQQVGDFDERLDVGAAGCNGDSEMWYRVLAAGYACRYEPSAVIFHHHRQDMAALKRQIFYYMRGHIAALLVQYERHGHSGNLRRLVGLARYLTRLVVQGVPSGFRGRYRTLFQEIAGSLSGVVFYIRHRYPRQHYVLQREHPSADPVIYHNTSQDL